MEIRVEQRLSGKELRAELLDKYGDRATLEKRAGAGGAEAADDLVLLENIEEAPAHLDRDYTITTVYRVKDKEILLTEPRLRMMGVVSKAAKARRPLGVTQLAKRLKRDKKNVSNDVAKLEKLGLLRTKLEGQRKLVLPHGNDIHLILDG